MSILETAIINFDTISSALLRTKLRHSKKDMSEISTETNIKLGRLKKIFSGKKHPTMVDLISLSRAMNFSIGEFYSEVERAVDEYINTGAYVRFPR